MDDDGDTALHCIALSATAQSHTETAQKLTDWKIPIDAKATDGSTALLSASWKGAVGIFNLLLSHGADVHSYNNEGDRVAPRRNFRPGRYREIFDTSWGRRQFARIWCEPAILKSSIISGANVSTNNTCTSQKLQCIKFIN